MENSASRFLPVRNNSIYTRVFQPSCVFLFSHSTCMRGVGFVCHCRKYLARESHILLGFATTKGVLEPLKEPSIWPPTYLDLLVFNLGVKASLKCALVWAEKALTFTPSLLSFFLQSQKVSELALWTVFGTKLFYLPLNR